MEKHISINDISQILFPNYEIGKIYFFRDEFIHDSMIDDVLVKDVDVKMEDKIRILSINEDDEFVCEVIEAYLEKNGKIETYIPHSSYRLYFRKSDRLHETGKFLS
jgi:hypothetical protein